MIDLKVSLFDVVFSISNVIDMISPKLDGHHKRTAYLALRIAESLGLSTDCQSDIFLAGLLHDCGALSLKEKLDALKFELERPHHHAEVGYQFLKNFTHFKNAAKIIRYHHVDWEDIKNNNSWQKEIPLGSSIIHLADRLDVLFDKQDNVSGQINRVCRRISNESGHKFSPELVDCFLELCQKEDLLQGLFEDLPYSIKEQKLKDTVLDFEETIEITKLFERIIDFRSSFTANHSSGVAAVAEALGRFAGLEEGRCILLRIAGYLHDVGKLAIPVEYIEKPGKLTNEEYEAVKLHALYSYQVLSKIKGFEEINRFASFHHERLNGKGYPFFLKKDDLDIESRIVCVADIFTAITEDRPYRKGMCSENSLRVLKTMADNNGIDPELVSILEEFYDQINIIRIEAQAASESEYKSFRKNCSFL